MNRLLLHGNTPLVSIPIRYIRGGHRATVYPINIVDENVQEQEFEPLHVRESRVKYYGYDRNRSRNRNELDNVSSYPETHPYNERWRKSSIERWPEGSPVQFTDRSELPASKQDKSFHPFFDSGRASLTVRGQRRVEERVHPSYYQDPSLQKASINKHIYKLLPKFTIFHRYYDEEKAARRKLPVPVSLTGLGLQTDERGIKYWTNKLQYSIEQLSRKTLKSDNFVDNVPPSVKLLIENDLLDEEHKELAVKYQDEVTKMTDESELIKEQKADDSVQFPFELATQIKNRLLEEIKSDTEYGQVDIMNECTDKELIDIEYQEYQKHQDLLKFVSSHTSELKLNKLQVTEFDSELVAWKNEFWRRSYGTSDQSVPPSNVPCGGCGAHLHCTNQSIPGYLPSEQFKNASKSDLKKLICSRCNFLEHFNVSIDVNVHPDEYPKILSTIKDSKSIVILMVDLLDFPSSIWPNIVPLIGENKKLYIVGNKVDLLPTDGQGYLDRVTKSLQRSLTLSGIHPPKMRIRSLNLISAKTGYGIEPLITKLLLDRKSYEDIYLIGCTNVGKSTLFNHLMQSDLCALRQNDLIHRATTSLWPGTTLNTLKFPVARLEGWQLKMRQERLLYENRIKYNEYRLRRSLWKQDDNPTYTNLADRSNMVVRQQSDPLSSSVMSTFRPQVDFTVESNHPFARKSNVPKVFNEKDRRYTDSMYFFDTPGTVYKDQILTLLTTEELLKTIPRQIITPRTFTLQPFQTLFVGGLGRIDVLHARQNVLLTVFASKYLPIHVIYSHEADTFYNMFIGSSMLGVPIGGEDRIKKWPKLVPEQFDINGYSWRESCGDIVLSSAGWVSVTIGRDETAVLNAYTPDKRGLFFRSPSILPFAVQDKGKRIPDTPCFQTVVRTIEEFDGWNNENEGEEQNKIGTVRRKSVGLPVQVRGKGKSWQEVNLNYEKDYRKERYDPMRAIKLRRN